MLDEFRSTNITWDKATSRIYSPVTANASDENGRKLVVQIVNGGQVEDLTGATLHLYWETRDKLHDGLDVFKAVDLKKGEFELSYTTGMLSNKGVLNANLVLIDMVGRVVSERFKITVTEGIDNDAIQSENSFSSLTQALIDVSNLEQNYAPRLNDLTAQLQQTKNELEAKKIDKNSGAVTSADLSQEVKEQMTGGSVAVVGKNAVARDNIINNQVTNDKLNVLGVEIPKLFDFGPYVQGASSRYSNEMFLETETVIALSPTSFVEFAVIEEGTSITSWGVDSFQVSKAGLHQVRVRKRDGTVISEVDFNELNYQLYCYRKNAINDDYYLTNKISNNVLSSYLRGIETPFDILSTLPDGSFLTFMNRSTPYFSAVRGQVLRFKVPTNLSFTIYYDGISRIPWSKEYTFTEAMSDIYLIFRRDDKGVPTGADLNILQKDFVLVTSMTNQKATKQTLYVTLSGNDDNKGLSQETAFASLAKALSVASGDVVIYMQRGVYKHHSAIKSALSSPLDSLTILPLDNATWDSSNPSQSKKIVFEGADYLSDWEVYNEIYKHPLTNAPNYNAVFVDKTMPIMSGGSRPSPNVILWEVDNDDSFDIDYMMTPVLTLAEVEDTPRSFFWDGTDIYINPIDIDNKFVLPLVENGIEFSSIQKLEVSEVVAQNYLNRSFVMERVKKMTAWDCEAHRSSKTDGFSLDYTYGVMHRPKANKNRNDGFNNHFQGDLTIYDIEARNNMDDGASPHEGCSIILHGGIVEGSGKGGLIPAAGGFARAYNVIFKNNHIGFHNAENPLDQSISSGNLYVGNTIGIKNDHAGDFLSVNDTFINNTTDIEGVINQY